LCTGGGTLEKSQGESLSIASLVRRWNGGASVPATVPGEEQAERLSSCLSCPQVEWGRWCTALIASLVRRWNGGASVPAAVPGEEPGEPLSNCLSCPQVEWGR